MSAPDPGPDDATPPPIWRDEFPLTSQGEDFVARRDFVRYLLAASGVLAAGGVGAALWATFQSANTGEPLPIVALDQVPEGTEHLFRYPTDEDPAILVHLPGGDLRAFTQRCTHLGCVVFYQPDHERLFCPCHEGEFDPATGAATGGPPDRPLARIDLEVREGTIWARGIQG